VVFTKTICREPVIYRVKRVRIRGDEFFYFFFGEVLAVTSVGWIANLIQVTFQSGEVGLG